MQRLFSARLLGLSGTGMLLIGTLWSAVHNYIASRNDPPGWIVDRALYQPPVLVSLGGLVVLMCAASVALAKLVRKIISR